MVTVDFGTNLSANSKIFATSIDTFCPALSLTHILPINCSVTARSHRSVIARGVLLSGSN